ncbi:MAG: hypothetical protein ACKVS6_10290 [Planctomycetota bacterium]
MKPFALNVLWLAFAATASQTKTAETQPIRGLRLDASLQKTSVLLMEALELSLTLVNESGAVLQDSPRLQFDTSNLTIQLSREGKNISFAQPVPLSPKHDTGVAESLGAGARKSARFSILFDWDTATYPFMKPGSYTLTVSARARNGRSVTSSALQFSVVQPSEAQRAELMELHATDAYQYTFAPGVIVNERNADERVKQFLEFHAKHPGSPFAEEAHYVAAVLYDYRSIITYRNEEAKAAEAKRLLKNALEDYIRAGRGRYVDDARQLLTIRFPK